MRMWVSVFHFNNLSELYRAIGETLTGRQMEETLVENKNRLEIYEDTLSDGSKVLNARFNSATKSACDVDTSEQPEFVKAKAAILKAEGGK